MKTVLIARAYIVAGTKTLVDARKHGNRLFGGKIKANETITQGLRRELDEELGERFSLGQVVAVTEQHKRHKRVIEVVMIAHPTSSVFEAQKRGPHNPQWIEIEESGMRFGVNLE